MEIKEIIPICDLAGSLVSLVAAWFWFQSAKTNLPAINPTTGQPVSAVSMLELYKTVYEASRINKIAAKLTGVSVILFAISGFLAWQTTA